MKSIRRSALRVVAREGQERGARPVRLRQRWFAALALAGLVAAGCGGSDSGSSETDATSNQASTDPTSNEETPAPTSTSEPTTVPNQAAVADAVMIEAAVDARLGSSTEFVALMDPTPVAVGDTVRTDTSGYAEIAYFDGSVTRLDVDTEFDVLELIDTVEASTIRTRMGVGRTWHRVSELGENGEYSVETNVATAVVQGTAFTVFCPADNTCTFVVVEGSIRLDLPDGTTLDLVAPAAVTIDAEGPSDIVPVPFDGVFGDEWLVDNAERDTGVGFDSGAEVYRTHGPAYGSIAGTFSGPRTVNDRSCESAFCEREAAPVGDVADRTYQFLIDCSSGVPCTGVAVTELRRRGELLTEEVPVTFDGSMLTWTVESTDTACLLDFESDGTIDSSVGVVTSTITWQLTPTAGDIVDGRWVVTEMQGRIDAFTQLVNTGGEPSCAELWEPGATASETSSVSVTRAD